MREFEEARECASADNDYTVSERALTEDDLVSIAEVIPTDKEFAIGKMKTGKSRLMASPYWRRLAECL